MIIQQQGAASAGRATLVAKSREARLRCNQKECGKKIIVHYKAIVKIMGVQTIEVQPKRVR